MLKGQWKKAVLLHRFLTKHFSYDENGSFHGRIPQIGIALSIPQGRWGGFEPDCRNTTLIHCNQSGNTGCLIVDRSFLGKRGTLAAWVAISPRSGDVRGNLLTAGSLSVGYDVSNDKPTGFVKIGERLASGHAIPANRLGLFAWTWEEGTEIGHTFYWRPFGAKSGKTTTCSTPGVMPQMPGPIALFNDEELQYPFRGSVLCLAVWDEVLSTDALAGLERC